MSDNNLQIISFLTLRRIIGAIGILLPITLMVGDFIFSDSLLIQSSISNYYSTPMRNVLVGFLFVLGFFLLSYKGYEPIDNITGTLGFFFSLGVALFPCNHALGIVRGVHFASAALLFCVFIVFSLFLFTKSDKQKERTKGKKQRNLVYIVCGIIMIVSLLAIALLVFILPKEQIDSSTLIFWLETTTLWSFGVSWLVKGRFLVTS